MWWLDSENSMWHFIINTLDTKHIPCSKNSSESNFTSIAFGVEMYFCLYEFYMFFWPIQELSGNKLFMSNLISSLMLHLLYTKMAYLNGKSTVHFREVYKLYFTLRHSFPKLSYMGFWLRHDQFFHKNFFSRQNFQDFFCHF